MCDSKGCVQVDTTLRSISDAAVFAAGDCASIQSSPRPKAGVLGCPSRVHLARNLRLAARHRTLKRWRPQREALVILGWERAGGGWRNGLSVSGTLVWRWKIGSTGGGCGCTPNAHDANRRLDALRRMRRQGGAEVLAGALADHPVGEQDLLIGLDARTMRGTAGPRGQLLVQSVDHFRAFLDDPFLFGQIAGTCSVRPARDGCTALDGVGDRRVPFGWRENAR